MKRFRVASQVGFFIVFLWIFFLSIIESGFYSEETKLKGGIKYLFAVDPLLAITTFLSNLTLEKIFLWSIPFLMLTLVFGRFFCGWVCPFGTIHHFVSFVSERFGYNNKSVSVSKIYKIKYIILLSVLVISVFKINLAGYFDPLAILVRSMSVFVLTLLSNIYNIPLAPDRFKDFLYNYLLGREYFYYSQSVFIGVIFLVLLGMNFYVKRFWCVGLCPLGALYGAFAKFSFFKLKQKEGCINCKRCDESCTAMALPSSKEFKSSECMLLFDCVKRCPVSVLDYASESKPSKIDFTKREFLSSVIISLSTVSLYKVANLDPNRNPKLIRPPGSIDEKRFLSTCIRCGGCMKVCPENFLQPAFLEAGLEGVWTPVANPNFGYCLYNCNLCGQVCPTGAIKNLPLDKKKKFIIGTAYFDKNRCLPYAFDTNCMVCEEHCPTVPKAIYFVEVETVNKKGEKVLVKQPHVNPDLCIGCGICQYKCPITDKPAIYITPIKRGGLI